MKTAPVHEAPEGAKGTDLVLRLRYRADENPGPEGPYQSIYDEAADEILRLRAAVKTARVALKD